MTRNRITPALLTATGLSLLALALACGGGGSSTTTPLPAPIVPTTGGLTLTLSDAATEDWALIGVKVLNVTLTPKGGGTPVTVFTAGATPATLNLAQLDKISDLIGTAAVPPGTYTGVTLTVAANPGDISLTASSNPSTGFDGVAGQAVPAADIQIKDAVGSTGAMTVPVSFNLGKNLVVTAGQTANLDLEFVLSHPAFIVSHVQPAGAATLWTVNFSGTVADKVVPNPEQLILRHAYGNVTQVAADNKSITVIRDFPAQPATNPETAVATLQTLQLNIDAANGTLFRDLDAKTSTTLKDFSSVATTLATKYIRTVARFQPDGSLVAVRMWASSSFNSVWLSPEGHIAHVALGSSSTPYQIFVDDENGVANPVVINNETDFYFRVPQSALADATPMATGTGFMDAHNLVRGFKVHISPVDPKASPLVAASVDIENAGYSGYISGASATGFTYTRTFANTPDNYTASLGFVPSTTVNGSDASGTPVTGYKWWDLTLPTLADSGATAIPDFVTAVGGAVNFGGTAGLMKVWGSTTVIPSDATLSKGWAAKTTIIEPIKLPAGTVVAPFTANATGGTFSMTVKGGGSTPVVVNLSNSSAAGTVIYQEDLNGKIYTFSPIDITTNAGLSALRANLTAKAPVVVYGVPNVDGTIMAYVLYFTSTGAL